MRTLYQFRLRRNDKRGHGSAVSLRDEINRRDTALPCPDFGNLNPDATGIDINPHYKTLPRAVRNLRFKILGGKIWRSQLTVATPHTANRNQHL